MNDLPSLLIWLGDVILIIVIVAICCYLRRHRDDDRRRRQAAVAAAPRPHATPEGEAAAQMAAVAAAVLLDHVTYPRGNDAAEEEDCAICLGQFDDGDWCSVMPVCRHEFHRSCIAKWLMARNNTCPLCRAQLQWDIVAHDMV